MYATWVHGNTVRPQWIDGNLEKVAGRDSAGRWEAVPWSDVNGLPQGTGATYRGRRSFAYGEAAAAQDDPVDPFRGQQKGTWFHFAIPTPVLVPEGRAWLQRVFVLWTCDESVQPVAVHVFDGVRPVDRGVFAVTPNARGASGQHGFASDLIVGVTHFELPSPHEMWWGVGISMAVRFAQEGEITFHAAGADFYPRR
jgi:hypothetical protein